MHRLTPFVACFLLCAAASTVRAEEAPPKTDAPSALDGPPLGWPRGEKRHFALIYDPFTIAEARYGVTLQILPVSHHAIVFSPYYMYTHTNADSQNTFQGPGFELGYHYFFGHDGPRGLYIGPSFLLGFFDGIPPQNADHQPATVHFQTWGIAADVGWQAILLGRLVLGIGVGVQYSQPTTTLPIQELPAGIYANRSVTPRLSFALGVAF